MAQTATEDEGDSYSAGLRASVEGRHVEAISHFEQALRESPSEPRILFALGNTAAAIGHSEAAENFFHRVLEQEPQRLEAIVHLANLWRKAGRIGEVVGLLKPALEANPQQADLWLTLGSAMRESGDAANAQIFYREALRLAPENAAALGNLADLLADEGSLDEGLALYERAVSLEPENAQARLNRAILLFLKGDLAGGFRDYEFRLTIKEREIFADHGLSAWDGQIAKDANLLVTAEQGVGDQLMFASLIPQLAADCARAGGRVLLEAEPRLVRLFVRSFPNVSVYPSHISRVGGRVVADYAWLKVCGRVKAAVAIGSLPRFMRRTMADFPDPKPYLKAYDVDRMQWWDALREKGAPPFIGLCWRSGSLGGLRNLQYAPLQRWAEFIRQMPGTPVALQYDLQTDEIEALQQMSGRTILVPPALDQKQEIDRTAGLIAALDVVVSAPTSVAWISGGLGVPTLKILYNSSWTAFGRDYEPFAPFARCIMPAKSGDWADTFSAAGAALKSLLSPV